MDVMKLFNLSLVIILSMASINANAGKIYRFIDKDGTSTMSKILPPYAAQQGYDILDDTSLRLIERVYTQKDLIKIQAEKKRVEQAEEKERSKIEANRIKKAEQRARDRNLLARYPTEQVFIKSRDADLNYQQSEIDDLKTALSKNKHRLVELQTIAAEAEINGETIRASIEKNLTLTENAITKIKQTITESIDDKAAATKSYEKDLTRLRQLLNRKN